mmetsp:Transcript_50756/g.101401  ORF Transcript_50756/g.101401 Transcript_50756/m.101401 type:complete len:281 (-) Transcript_50756:92-934(-)
MSTSTHASALFWSIPFAVRSRIALAACSSQLSLSLANRLRRAVMARRVPKTSESNAASRCESAAIASACMSFSAAAVISSTEARRSSSKKLPSAFCRRQSSTTAASRLRFRSASSSCFCLTLAASSALRFISALSAAVSFALGGPADTPTSQPSILTKSSYRICSLPSTSASCSICTTESSRGSPRFAITCLRSAKLMYPLPSLSKARNASTSSSSLSVSCILRANKVVNSGKSITPAPSASTSLMMSCSSVSVGFCPSDRITVPSWRTLIVPERVGSKS